MNDLSKLIPGKQKRKMEAKTETGEKRAGNLESEQNPGPLLPSIETLSAPATHKAPSIPTS
jgi:hypothetical protein